MTFRRLQFLLVPLTFLIPFLAGLSVHRQGFNLLDDGLWLLGTGVLAEGGTLYGDVFSIYGPARYFLLFSFFLILGKSALTLAVFKAVLDGTAALFGYLYLRRLGAGRWAWAVPLGVVAFAPVYPRYLAAAFFAALVGWALRRQATRRQAVFVGLGWGGLGLFGLDMAGYGAVILLGGWLFSRWLITGGPRPSALPVAGVAAGLATVMGSAALTAAILGVLDQAFWDTVVYPVTRFRDSMGVSWTESFFRDPLLRDPFSGHFTGETLGAAWPGHAWARVFGFRAMFLLVWLVPVAFLPLMRRFGDVRWGPLLALALSGWVTLMARGDIVHLRLVWFGTLLALLLLVSHLPGRRIVRGVIGGLLLLITVLPFFTEQVWLAIHLDRATLARWERPSARVYLAREKVETLETMCSELPWDGIAPVLVWPASPGLQFVLEAPLATPQATLLGGEVRRSASVIADLQESRPPILILGNARGIMSEVNNLQGLAPALWAHLRRRYERVQEYAAAGGNYLVASRIPDAKGRAPQLEARLPGAAQEMATSTSPVLGPGVSVAQTFRVRDFDLGGMELLFRSPGPYPYKISFVLTFHELGGSAGTRLLQQIPVSIPLDKRTQKVKFNFEPIAGTKGKLLLMDISGHPDGTQPFSLLWNKSTEEFPEFEDFYPGGQVFFNVKPLQADLFFISY